MAELHRMHDPEGLRRPAVCAALLLALPALAGGDAGWAGAAAHALVEGARLGLLIALGAVGLTLIYGTTRMVNLAHGEFLAVGAMLALVFNSGIIGPGMYLAWAAVLAALVTMLLGAGLERGLWRPLRERGVGLTRLHLLALALAVLLQQVAFIVWLWPGGGAALQYHDHLLQRPVELGPLLVRPRDLVVAVLALAALATVSTWLGHARLGKAIRALIDGLALAQTCGIDPRRVTALVWALAGLLGALAGVGLGLTEGLGSIQGLQMLLLLFAGAALGGLGNVSGAVLGSIVVGVGVRTAELAVPQAFAPFAVLAVTVLLLRARPGGLLGDGRAGVSARLAGT